MSSLFGPSASSPAYNNKSGNRSIANNRQRDSDCPSSNGALDPESFTFATVGPAGAVLALPAHGITLSIPEGALEKG